MLITLVRDSVMQCFCHTCRAPLPSVRKRGAPFKKPTGIHGKPRTKQPKKVKFITTEIRCQEKTKGGVCYEVILAEPTAQPTLPKRPASPKDKVMSVQDIEEKLKAAEERRLSLEANKMAAIAAKMSKIEEASKKKDEQTTHFISQTKEALDQKMETHVEKREAYISDLKSKMKEHIESVEKTRLTLEQQTSEVRNAIEAKLQIAAAHRGEHVTKMLDRLREHEEQVQKVRNSNAEKFQQLETTIQEKLDQAKSRREIIESEQKEKLRNHNTMKLAEVRQSIEIQEVKKSEEKNKILETKLSAAEANREKEIQRKLENIKKNERRAEIVRQNKANLASKENEPETVTASG